MKSLYTNMTYAERMSRTPLVDTPGDNQDVAQKLRDYVREMDIQTTLRNRAA